MAINLPAKVLRVTVTSIKGIERWPYSDGPNDRWWAGGVEPRHYKWEIEVSVTIQKHSSHASREPFEYNAFDIKVGDWIANANTGVTLKVVGVISKTNTDATLVVEDVNRYNTFRDPAGLGDGSIGTGSAVLFTVNEEGMPLLDTLIAGYVSEVFLNNVTSRFQNLNLEYDYILTQPGHTFEVGDLISADAANNQWVLSSTVNNFVVGRVSELGPTPDQFYITPIQKIIDNLDNLPGDVASILYIDDNDAGNVTENGTTPIYIKLRNETPTSLTSTITPISVTAGSILNINGVDVTFNVGDQNDVITSINAVQSQTNVTASAIPVPTVSSPVIQNLWYGTAGAAGNTQAGTINGIPFVFDITGSGTAQFGVVGANASDMVAAITRDVTSVDSNIIAYEDAGLVYIKNLSGGPINITTTTTDASGLSVAGPNSTTGLNPSTSGTSDVTLKVEGQDASRISFKNVNKTPQEDLGLYTVENGTKAAALYIEKGISNAKTTIVADIPSRDALTPVFGDQTLVLDKGNGDWELYIWDGSQWIVLANQDSAKSDADSAELIVTPTTQSLTEIVTVSTSSRVTLITVEVTQPFDGSPTLSVGTSNDTDMLLTNDLVDLTAIGTYASQTDVYFNTGVDTDIIVHFQPNGATVGVAKVVISYM